MQCEKGKESDPWSEQKIIIIFVSMPPSRFGVCSDLIKSKFDVSHYKVRRGFLSFESDVEPSLKPYNRTGVAIRSVYKIHNQYLQRRFDDHVSTMSK